MSEPPFSRWVRDRMRERGLGLRELCREAEVDPSFLSKVLQGKRSPPWDEDVLRRMARVLEVEAPRLIACAGRIPGEWGALSRDGELFAAVDRLVRGLPSRQADAPPRGLALPASVRGAQRPSPKAKPEAFGEELL